MIPERLLALLEKSEGCDLSPAEERELAELLENPSHRAVAETRLAPLRRTLADYQAYHAAAEAKHPAISPRTLDRLMAGVSATPPSRVVTFPWWRSTLALGALAACVAVIWSLRPPSPRDNPAVVSAGSARIFALNQSSRLVIEYGFIGSATVVRDISGRPKVDLGPDWRTAAHATRRDLEAWSQSELAPGVQGRIWIDEEAGLLRAVYRQSSGDLATLEQPVQTDVPVAEQLLSVANRIRSQ